MDSPILYSTKRWLRILDSRWTRKTRTVQFRGHGFRFYSTYWWSDVSQALLETEIAPYFEALDQDFRPSVIIDAGAATGHFAVLAATLFPSSTVYAFEPSERQRVLLARNARLNGVRNLEIQPFGLWNRADQLAFRTNGAESSFESVSRFRGQLPFLETAPVQSLDAWLREKKISGVDFIKMDAEGAELEILEGAEETLKGIHPRLLIQAYHLRDGARTFERCAEMLAAQNYLIAECPPASGLLYARQAFANS
ncbi:MAG: FkbM family methyltransferase [Spartobacteria bacterium]